MPMRFLQLADSILGGILDFSEVLFCLALDAVSGSFRLDILVADSLAPVSLIDPPASLIEPSVS